MKTTKKLRNRKISFSPKQEQIAKAAFTIALVCATTVLMAQTGAGNGNGGINAAESQVRGYFDDGTKLVTTVGAVAGLVGAVKVYNKWNQGDPDTAKVAASWFGSCIFLVVVAQILRGFFL
ncbi:hypothetical protein AAKU52_002628 [Pedobacter sp. CG_S7]|uniref:DUF4134 domain-containing protein n=1 Tax=Pedobacter sp. CG_S7 TaxID=3143930 RepID=UPI003392FD18